MEYLGSRVDLFKRFNRPTVGAEIGVLVGEFSEKILSTRVCRLYLVDCWAHQPGDYELDPADSDSSSQEAKYQFVVNRFKPYGERVKIVRQMSLNAATMFADKSMDWVYIDANHLEGEVYKDLSAWSTKVKPGGLIMGHDYCINGKTLKMKMGVYNAVNRFCAENGYVIEALTTEEWSSYAIRKTK